MNFIKTILCLSIYLTSTNIFCQEELKKQNLLKIFFEIIRNNDHISLQKILNCPRTFSKIFGFDYTAEELCNLQDRYGRTSLHTAAMSQKVTKLTAELLIKSGAHVNAQDIAGLAPLHFPQNNIVATILIQFGADPKTQDHDHEDPIQHADNWIKLQKIESKRALYKLNQYEQNRTIRGWFLSKRKDLLEGGIDYQIIYAETIENEQKAIAKNVRFNKAKRELENIHMLVTEQSSQAISDSQKTIQAIQDAKKINALKELAEIEKSKDNAAIERSLAKGRLKNQNFSEKSLYDIYMKKSFKTTNSVELQAIDRRSDILYQRIKDNTPKANKP